MVLHPEVAFAADKGPQRCYYRSRSCWKVRRAAENVPPPCWCLFARALSEVTWPLCRHFDDVTHTHTHNMHAHTHKPARTHKHTTRMHTHTNAHAHTHTHTHCTPTHPSPPHYRPVPQQWSELRPTSESPRHTQLPHCAGCRGQRIA